MNVPNGFAVTAKAYRHFLKAAGIEQSLREAVNGEESSSKSRADETTDELSVRGAKARKIILQAQFPDDLKAQILVRSIHHEPLCSPLKKIHTMCRIEQLGSLQEIETDV